MYLYSYSNHLQLHSFPTRRSSDLFSVTDTNSSRTSEAALWPSTYISPLSNSTPCIRKDRISSKSLMRLSICLWKPSIGDRKSGSAGMPRPISYAVFCLKKKTGLRDEAAHRVTTESVLCCLVSILPPPRSTLFPYTTLFRSYKLITNVRSSLMAVNIHITIIELNALHTKRQNLFQELDAVIHLLMEAKHWGLRKSRNATSLNSRFKSLDTLKVKIISVTFRRVIRTNHKKASKIWRHENIQLGGCQS